VRVIGSGIFIRRGENGVPLGAEFLEGLGCHIFIPFFSYFFERWFRERVLLIVPN
jgi:hypothetical protein